ncbi:hypothetical protein [Geofilum rubicundum]|uniref:Uncharacterized protein n=1 Tax=Geofilum rubicundum JCM 15548 TaxID=1236989 RepID=A0A0E9LXQ2_9BACT|nr:hypothetical protein [Geofilum rubicundum]GAO29896.1 hypothetical protein JCM15548_12131 [Geofilum rubicundum JCM 15548]
MRNTIKLLFGLTMALTGLNFHLSGEESHPPSANSPEDEEYLIHLEDAVLSFNNAFNWDVQIDETLTIHFSKPESGSSFIMRPIPLKPVLDSLYTDALSADSIFTALNKLSKFKRSKSKITKISITKVPQNPYDLKGQLIINNKAFELQGNLYTEEDKDAFDQLIESFALVR